MITKTMKTNAILCAAALSVALIGGCAKNHSIPEGRRHMDAAESSFAAGAGRAPTAATTYSFAKILISQGRDRDALYVLDRIVREHPKYAPAYNEIANVYVRADRIDDAIAVLDSALQQAPKDGVLSNNRGMCYMLAGDYEKALADFTRAADVCPTVPAFRCNRATALGLLGNKDAAKKEYLTVLGVHQTQKNLDVLTKVNSENEEKGQSKDGEKVEAPPATQPVAAAELEALIAPAAPIVEPQVETPTAPLPEVEAPEAEAPSAETPEAEAPTVESPEAEAPTVESPEAEAPTVESPEPEAPTAELPEVDVEQIQEPRPEAPQAEAEVVETPSADELKLVIHPTPIEQESRADEDSEIIEPDCVTEPDAALDAVVPSDDTSCSDHEDAA